MRKLRGNTGYTLIELVFTVSIIGILFAFSMPKYLGYLKDAHNSNIKSIVGTIQSWSIIQSVENYNNKDNLVYPLPNSATINNVIEGDSLRKWNDSDPSNWQYYAGGGIVITGDGSYFKATPIFIP